MSTTPAGVLGFWREAGPEKWFKKDPGFDQAIAARYGSTVEQAMAGAFDHWPLCWCWISSRETSGGMMGAPFPAMSRLLALLRQR